MGRGRLNDYSPPVLIVGFRRSENLLQILKICKQAGIKNIFVTLDGPRTGIDRNDIHACEKTLVDFDLEFPGELRTRTFQINQGAAQSVLGGLDWVFETEEFAVVIEDDCLPARDFFEYVSDAKRFLDSNESIFLIGGNQFVPDELTQNHWFLSEYPLIWGWATSRKKWTALRQELRKAQNIRMPFFISSESAFWGAGARRALSGHVDAWDTPLVYVLRMNGWKTILPGRNLVTNIGNDFAATHTILKSRWIGIETQDYERSSVAPVVNRAADHWLKKNLYKISKRHLVTTKITLLLDYLGINKKKRTPLLERWC
jgi:hypothetical protein